MLTLQELFDRVILDAGQFILPQTKLEIHLQRFKILVQTTLGFYNKYCPISVHLHKNIQSTRQYTFTTENTSTVPWKGQNVPYAGAPEWLVEIIPIRISGVYPFYVRDYDRPKSNVDVKVEFPWEYRNPTLTVPVQGEYDIHAVYYHRILEDLSGVDPLLYIPTLSDDDDQFLELLSARFMIGIGRSRRAFTMTDLPITTDAAELVAEGKEREKDTMESIATNDSKFYLAWR